MPRPPPLCAREVNVRRTATASLTVKGFSPPEDTVAKTAVVFWAGELLSKQEPLDRSAVIVRVIPPAFCGAAVGRTTGALGSNSVASRKAIRHQSADSDYRPN